MEINFKHLRTFLLVAENSSFRDASDQVHRSQSAVSAQIKQLEEQLGTALFHRTTRRVKLTAAGEQLLQAAQRGLREVEAGVREIQETLDLRSGRVSVASSPIMAATLLPPILAAFETHYPAVRILVRELTPADLYESVLRGDADFGIGPASESSEFDFETILKEDIYALVPRRFMPSDSESIPLKELAPMPVLLLSNATALRSMLDDSAKRCGMTLRPKYECTQAQTLISMANVELGAAILPKSIVPCRPDKRVQALRIVSPVLSRRMGLITVHGRHLSPAASRLAQLIRESIDSDSRRSPKLRLPR